MTLRSGIDTVGIVSHGNYTETYDSSSNPQNIAAVFASKGLLETAPNVSINIIAIVINYFRRRREQ